MKNIICPRCGNLISADEIGSPGYKMPVCKGCERHEVPNADGVLISIIKLSGYIFQFIILLPYLIFAYMRSLRKTK